ncbi:MAG: GNAT family N-acetyltransferase [Desulfovibrionaceae bacterium]|nr:GNAT family N-acetyltransferase [Desulfovibrionaceae bacterium]
MDILFQTLPNAPLPADLRDAWFAAAGKSELPDPCCSEPPWVVSYHRAISPDRRVLLLSEHGNLVCLAEERDLRGKVFLVPLESSWLYDRPLLGQDPLPLFFKAVALLEEEYEQVPDIILGGMWPHYPLCNELVVHLGHVFSFYRLCRMEQGAASLEGGLDGFLANRSANFRQKLKKARRKTADIGVHFERICPTSEQEASTTYARMLAIEERSWKGLSGTGIVDEAVRSFYALLLCDLAQTGRARVIIARKDERDIGFIFGGFSGTIYRGQQFSFDQDFAKYSLGNVLQYETIRWLTEDGCMRYDMGPVTGPKMGYKSHWTELTFPLESWILKHR